MTGNGAPSTGRFLIALTIAAAVLLSATGAQAVAATPAAQRDDLAALARDFWAWRAAHQPFSGDDIPRLDRPAGWRADWSPAAFAERHRALAGFESRWKRLDPSAWSIAQQVDYPLIGSAMARVRWELEVAPGWRRNPYFYVDQTLGAVFERLLPPPPFDEERAAEIVRRLESIPQTLAHARENLDDARAPFARLAVEELRPARERLSTVARELRPLLPGARAGRLDAAVERATEALERYRGWLEQRLPSLPAETAVGREAYVFFLRNVALLPFTPERLLVMGRQERDRAVAFEAYEQNRNRSLPELALPRTAPDQIERMRREAEAVRRFLAEQEILTVPAWVRRYPLRPMPGYLEPLRTLGVVNDFTGPERLDRDGVAYIRRPSPDNGYFERVYALDPRTQIAHEANGHYLQLVLSWAHEDPIRRHYYDSGPNEGIAFYNEELMLQAGLFDDSPHSRELIYSMMRLRALRVEVDVRLALGSFAIEEAADYLETAVPLDRETARQEAAFFASIPGQAITYQIGKLQILDFLAEARRVQGERFGLRAFHDFLSKNGNVPLVLQRWEYLGLRDQLDALDRM